MKKSPHGMVPGKAANTDKKIRLMRGAKTLANYSHGMGGLPRLDAIAMMVCLEAYARTELEKLGVAG